MSKFGRMAHKMELGQNSLESSFISQVQRLPDDAVPWCCRNLVYRKSHTGNKVVSRSTGICLFQSSILADEQQLKFISWREGATIAVNMLFMVIPNHGRLTISLSAAGDFMTDSVLDAHVEVLAVNVFAHHKKL